MTARPEINERDLRVRSKEIMDSVERGQSFVGTRDGHRIGDLVPFRRSRTFVSKIEFLDKARRTLVDPDGFREDLDSLIDNDATHPYSPWGTGAPGAASSRHRPTCGTL